MQHGAPFLTDRPVEVQTVLSAPQRCQRFVLPHGHIQSGNVAVRDIGRVADNTVKFPEAGRRSGKGIHLPGQHLRRQAAAANVLAAYTQRILHQLTQHHMAAGAELCHRQSYAATAGAQIQYPRLRQRLYEIRGLLRQHLRIGAGDQHAFVDVQIHAAEGPLADEIGQRLSGQMAPHQFAGAPLHLLRHIQPSVPQQLLPRLAGGKGHQFAGFQRGRVNAGTVEFLPDIHIQIVICCRHNTFCCQYLSSKKLFCRISYHLSLPFSFGSTSFTASMATSSMESSGSLVVKFCIHMPGADKIRVSLLS